jgi:hypothetical protein
MGYKEENLKNKTEEPIGKQGSEKTENVKDLPYCTTAPSAEHMRASNEDEPCDDGRAGNVGED